MDALVAQGIGPPGERGSIYRRWLAYISEAEKADGGVRKGWSPATLSHFRTVYDRFLQVYPWFAGYWIRLARAEFKLGNTDTALQVYRAGLAELPFCSDLWAAYLEFLVTVSHDDQLVLAEFDRAIGHAGDDFYAHTIYDVQIEYLAARGMSTQPLLDRIAEKTLHQFARYARDAGKTSGEAYLAQQERVAEAWKYECQLHRPFFHPKPFKQQERAVWLHYLDSQIENEPFKEQLFRRLLVCGALDESLWLRYARWLIAKRRSPLELFAAADRQLPSDLVQVRLYHALWLEFTGQTDDTAALYTRLGHRGAVQASQFVSRTGGDAQAVLVAALAEVDDKPADKVALLRELAKYDSAAFDNHPVDCDEYWHAFLAAFPERAEEIDLRAPDGLLTEAYLELLASTDVHKYVQVDARVHRRATG